jgi:hypothetical protein
MRSISTAALLFAICLSGAASAQVFKAPCNVDTLCPGVQPGGGKILNCLRSHKSELSEQCFAAIGHFTMNRPANGKKGAGAGAASGQEPNGADGPGDAGGAPPAQQ